MFRVQKLLLMDNTLTRLKGQNNFWRSFFFYITAATTNLASKISILSKAKVKYSITSFLIYQLRKTMSTSALPKLYIPRPHDRLKHENRLKENRSYFKPNDLSIISARINSFLPFSCEFLVFCSNDGSSHTRFHKTTKHFFVPDVLKSFSFAVPFHPIQIDL